MQHLDGLQVLACSTLNPEHLEIAQIAQMLDPQPCKGTSTNIPHFQNMSSLSAYEEVIRVQNFISRRPKTITGGRC